MNFVSKSLKYSLYLFFFGLLTVYAVFFRSGNQKPVTPAAIPGASTNLELLIQPTAGHAPLIEKINSAQTELLVKVYLLSDKEIISAIKNVHNRGVPTYVMLEEHPFGGGNLNPPTFTSLQTAGVNIKWSNPTFALTHEKTITVDGQTTCILNQNLSASSFTKNREYNICTANPADVNEVRQIFFADWNRTGYTPTVTNLVISPDTARSKITALINSAQKSLDVEMEVIEDKDMSDLLDQKAKTIPVRIITPEKLKSPYIHAKLIIADGIKSYSGSVNLTTASLDQNREIGIIVSDPAIIGEEAQTFESDWQKILQ